MKLRPTHAKGLRHFYRKTSGHLDITFLGGARRRTRYGNFARDGHAHYRCVGASCRLHGGPQAHAKLFPKGLMEGLPNHLEQSRRFGRRRH
jgi:hypothetical protein